MIISKPYFLHIDSCGPLLAYIDDVESSDDGDSIDGIQVYSERQARKGRKSSSKNTPKKSYAAFADIPYEQEHLDIVNCLLRQAAADGGVVNILNSRRDIHNNTHLHAAARLGRGRVVTILLQHGADVNVRNAYGESPLYLAVLFRHGAEVTCLLEHGADVALANEGDGNTPLHVAAAWGQAEAVGRLVKYSSGAVLIACNREGRTALELARNRQAYLDKRNIGNPASTIRLLEERLTAHAYNS